MTYTISTGTKKDGSWWARLETETHYSVGSAEDEHAAILNAVHEASGLIEMSKRTN